MKHTVRQEMETLLRTEAHLLAIHTRNKLDITQKQMAEILVMSESSCSDIETGHFGCCPLTLVRLLALQDDPADSIRRLNEKLEKIYQQEVQPV